MLFCQQHIAEPLPRDFHKQFFNLFQIFQQLVRKRETATRVSYALLFNAGSGLSSFTPSASEPAGCSTLRPSSRPPAPPCAAKHEAARSSPALQLPPRLPPRVPSPRARSRSALTAEGGSNAAALERLPEVFDRRDVCRVLGYEPLRGALYKALGEFVQDGVLTVEESGYGQIPGRYRRV